MFEIMVYLRWFCFMLDLLLLKRWSSTARLRRNSLGFGLSHRLGFAREFLRVIISQ